MGLVNQPLVASPEKRGETENSGVRITTSYEVLRSYYVTTVYTVYYTMYYTTYRVRRRAEYRYRRYSAWGASRGVMQEACTVAAGKWHRCDRRPVPVWPCHCLGGERGGERGEGRGERTRRRSSERRRSVAWFRFLLSSLSGPCPPARSRLGSKFVQPFLAAPTVLQYSTLPAVVPFPFLHPVARQVRGQ